MNLTAVHPHVATARARGFRGWTARHPLTAFLVLAFAGIYPMMSLPILASHDLIPAGLLQGDARALAMPIAVIVLTAVTAVVIRRRLTRAYRQELDALPAATNPSQLSGGTPR